MTVPPKSVPAELLGSGGTAGVVLVHDIYGRGPYVRSTAEASRRTLTFLSDLRGPNGPRAGQS